MEKTIWKYELNSNNYQSIEMPRGAEILSVQTEYGNPCMWALVNGDAQKESREFIIIGTGWSFDHDPEKHKFIGTFQLNSGILVFHLFECKK